MIKKNKYENKWMIESIESRINLEHNEKLSINKKCKTGNWKEPKMRKKMHIDIWLKRERINNELNEKDDLKMLIKLKDIKYWIFRWI
jgi:hypothetical protein